MIKYQELDAGFFSGLFPEFEEQIKKEASDLREFLPHCLFGNVLNPMVVQLLGKDNYLENKVLGRIFKLYEDFAVSGDNKTQELLQVTLLEYLWDEKKTYKRAMEIMGDGTMQIWNLIYEYMNEPLE